jgi:hypothetical protein
MLLRMKAIYYFKMLGTIQGHSVTSQTPELCCYSVMQFVIMFEAPLSESYFLFTVCLLHIAECGLFRQKKVHHLHDENNSSSFMQQHIHVHV